MIGVNCPHMSLSWLMCLCKRDKKNLHFTLLSIASHTLIWCYTKLKETCRLLQFYMFKILFPFLDRDHFKPKLDLLFLMLLLLLDGWLCLCLGPFVWEAAEEWCFHSWYWTLADTNPKGHLSSAGSTTRTNYNSTHGHDGRHVESDKDMNLRNEVLADCKWA